MNCKQINDFYTEFEKNRKSFETSIFLFNNKIMLFIKLVI